MAKKIRHGTFWDKVTCVTNKLSKNYPIIKEYNIENKYDINRKN